jgi:hypothetical protein
MMNNFRTMSIMAISAWTCLGAQAVLAQDPYGANYYERGIGAFFAGRSCQAEADLSLAIEANSQDPRAYYFRAMSLLRRGRIDEARGDMLVGSTLEAQQPHRFAIGAALERVQGPNRLMLEEFRSRARQNVAMGATTNVVAPATANVPAAASAPTQQGLIREGEAAVLRHRTVVPLEELLRPGGPHAIVDEPVNEPAELPLQGKQPPAAQPPAAPAADPFADDASRAAPTAVPAPAIPPQEAPKPAPLPPQGGAKPTPPANPPAELPENPFNG